MSKKQRTNLIPATGFRVLTCRIREEDDRAVFTDSPLIGWLQTNDPERDPVDPILLDDDGLIRLGSELEGYQVAYQVFPSEWHEGLRFQLKAPLETEARYLEARYQKAEEIEEEKAAA
jgi:hypothetical protein